MEKEEDDDEREKKSQMMAEYIEGAHDKKKVSIQNSGYTDILASAISANKETERQNEREP